MVQGYINTRIWESTPFVTAKIPASYRIQFIVVGGQLSIHFLVTVPPRLYFFSLSRVQVARIQGVEILLLHTVPA